MKLNKTDYVLERASDGGYYAWLNVYGGRLCLMNNVK